MTKRTVITNPNITADNYFNYYCESPGIRVNLFNAKAIDSIVTDYLKKRGFVIVRPALFELADKTIIPVSGYLPYEKVGYYIEAGVSYPKRAEQRTNPYCEYYKYTSDSTAYLLTFKDTTDNLFVFKANSYWWQYWDNKSYEKQNKDKILVTKEFAYRLLQQDIEKYFSKVEHKK